jgi:hypothetical protein
MNADLLDRGRPFAALARPALVNDAPGVIVSRGDRLVAACALTVEHGRLTQIDLVTDPAKLRRAGRTRRQDREPRQALGDRTLASMSRPCKGSWQPEHAR